MTPESGNPELSALNIELRADRLQREARAGWIMPAVMVTNAVTAEHIGGAFFYCHVATVLVLLILQCVLLRSALQARKAMLALRALDGVSRDWGW